MLWLSAVVSGWGQGQKPAILAGVTPIEKKITVWPRVVGLEGMRINGIVGVSLAVEPAVCADATTLLRGEEKS